MTDDSCNNRSVSASTKAIIGNRPAAILNTGSIAVGVSRLMSVGSIVMASISVTHYRLRKLLWFDYFWFSAFFATGLGFEATKDCDRWRGHGDRFLLSRTGQGW